MVVMADIECPVVRADVTCYWKDMWRRLDAMRRLWQLCDVRLKTDDGSSFMAHSPVLAASSDVLHHMLVAARHETFVDGPGVVPVRNVTPDVLRITLDFIYGVTPTSRADFERLRVGATRLGIEGAYEYCCRRLGENFLIFPHTRHATELPSGSVVATTEAATMVDSTAILEPYCTTVSNNQASQSEDASVGDVNSSAPLMQSDAVVSISDVPDSTDVVDAIEPPNDVHHAEMMAHMTLADLARTDECPHLRRLAGETIPPSNIEQLSHKSNGSVDDGSGFLDPVQLKKSIGTSELSDSQQSNIPAEVNGLYETETVEIGDARSIVSMQTCTTDLPPSAYTAALMSSSVQAPSGCPQAIFTDSISYDGSHCSTITQSNTPSRNIVASVDFNNPSYEAPIFPTSSVLKTEMMTCLTQDACMSYVSDNYHMTGLGNNSLWLADQHAGTAVTASDLSSLTSCMQPPYDVSSFTSILSTANVSMTASSVHSSTTDIVHRSSDILHGCPQDTNFTDCGVTPNHWSNGIVSSPSQGSVNGISHVISLPADNDLMYLGPNLVSNSVPPFVPPVLTMNPLSSSSSVAAPSSVVAAGSVAADLSYISLDDVSAVLKANGFSDKMSSPSAAEVSPENDTIDSHVGESRTSDINQTGTYTTVNETPSAVTRVCIFCKKPCKSER